MPGLARISNAESPVRIQAFDVFCSIIEETGGELITAPFPEYAEDPVGFAREKLGVRKLTIEQIAMLLSIQENRETNVQAGVGIGKSFADAVAVLWWIYAVGGRAITTAPRDSQLGIVWGEINDLHARNRWRLGGECLMKSLKLGGRVRAYGFVAKKEAKESFGGRHDPFLLAIVDEASGVEEPVDEGIVANLTYHTNRLARTGNPLAEGTPYHRACAANVLKIPIWTHPNIEWAYDDDGNLLPKIRKAVVLKDGTIREREEWPAEFQKLSAQIPGGPSIEWVEGRRADETRGPGTAYWTARLDAEFPQDMEGALVPRAWFAAARDRYEQDPKKWNDLAGHYPWRHGVDVGDGGDPHAIVSMRGPVLYEARTIMSKDQDRPLIHIRREIRRELEHGRGGSVIMDCLGIGSGPYQDLLEANVTGIYGSKFSGKPTPDAEELFLNERAQRYWMVRTAFQNGTIAIAKIDERQSEMLKEQLAATRYFTNTKGKIQMELKEKIKTRLRGRSPDLADGLALAQDLPRPEDAEGYYHEEIWEGDFSG